MESFKTNFFTQFLCGVFFILITFVFWIHRRQDFFKNLNIPYVRCFPLLGAFKDALLAQRSFYDTVLKLYNDPDVKGKPFFGMFMFHKPALMITDPELIKTILVKDFSNFTDRYSGSNIHDPLGNYNLFAVKNPVWKVLRGKLSPFFSSGKLRMMFSLLDKISSNLCQHVNKRLDKDNKVELEVKELAALYTTDVIASCAFGVEANSLENPEGDFRTAGAAMFKMTFWRGFELPAFFMLPQVMKFFNFTMCSSFTTKFIRLIIPQVISERERSGNKRNDLIDTLIELKRANPPDSTAKEFLSDDMLVAQAAVFFAAGFETSSATQSFALYEIAKNPSIQDKIRNEIKSMLERTNGEVTYDAVMNTTEMPYLHQIIYETLRMYSVISMLDRVCVNPEGYTLPKAFGDFKIPYGMPVYVPIYAIHRDEKYFPDPLKFDPERFAPENINNIQSFTHFPFGGGPRDCIGRRFGLMQAKTGLVKLLKEFRLETTENTPMKMILEKKAVLVQSEKGLNLNLIKDPLY